MNVISPEVSPADDSLQRLEQLADISQRLLERAKAMGASQAEVSCSDERGLDVNVRLGEVETVESTRDRGIAVTVYFGQRKGSASTADLQDASLESTVAQACAIARHTEDDAAAGLAEAALMARAFPDLDGWHPWDLGADEALTWPWPVKRPGARPMAASATPMAPRPPPRRACRCTPIHMVSSAASAAATTRWAAR